MVLFIKKNIRKIFKLTFFVSKYIGLSYLSVCKKCTHSRGALERLPLCSEHISLSWLMDYSKMSIHFIHSIHFIFGTFILASTFFGSNKCFNESQQKKNWRYPFKLELFELNRIEIRWKYFYQCKCIDYSEVFHVESVELSHHRSGHEI